MFPWADLRDTTSCRARLFLTVHATIGNQAFSHESCNTLSYNKVKITFLNDLRKNDVEAQVELRFKSHLSPVIDVSVKKDCLLVYILKFFEFLAGRWGSVVV